MPTKAQCEAWIGDKKQEKCSQSGYKYVTQTYGRKDTRTETQYGWSCSCCGKFFVSQRFSK